MDDKSVVEILAWVLYALLIVQNILCLWLAAQWRKTWDELEQLRHRNKLSTIHDERKTKEKAR